jgi:HlyD family secretion protein
VMDILRRDNVLAVPSDAIRNSRDAATVVSVLGVSPDSLRAALAAGRQGRVGRFGADTSGSVPSGTDTTGRRRFSTASSTPGAGGTASPTRRGGFSRQGGGGGGGAGAGGAAGGGETGRAGGAMVVFVKANGKYSPRAVRVGVSDFDYTEVLSGLKENEQVALLAAVVLEAQREAMQARIRTGTGGGLQQPTTPAAGGAGGGGRRGGGGGG